MRLRIDEDGVEASAVAVRRACIEALRRWRRLGGPVAVVGVVGIEPEPDPEAVRALRGVEGAIAEGAPEAW